MREKNIRERVRDYLQHNYFKQKILSVITLNATKTTEKIDISIEIFYLVDKSYKINNLFPWHPLFNVC